MNTVSETARLRALSPSTPKGGRQIGAILIDSGTITPRDAEEVLRLQKDRGLRFGEAAIKLGLISEADLHRVLASQYDYPYITTEESKVSLELVAAYRPSSPQVEMLRAIRSQLMLRWFTESRKQLAVVSVARGEGRSYLAANLAVVFSQLGERTLLLDADMRNPRQHALFGLEGSSGLSTFLSGRANEPRLNRVPGLIDLSVLSAGPAPPNPQELAARPSFGHMLGELSQQFDVIIIDTPAAETSADAQSLAVRAGGALLLARQDQTRLRAIAALTSAIRTTGGQIVGSVLARF